MWTTLAKQNFLECDNVKLEAVIEARILNNVLKAVMSVSRECVLNVSPDGLHTRAVDPSIAMMVDVEIPADVFLKYDAGEGDIGIDVDALFGKTNTFSAVDEVNITWDDRDKKINISGDGAKWGVRTIDANTVRKTPDMPNLDLPLNVEVAAEKFKRMLKRAGMVSEYITIGFGGNKIAEDTFYVSAMGEIDDFREDVSGEDITIDASATLETLYTYDMMSSLAKNFSGPVRIRLGRDLPVVFDLNIGVPVTFLLAPRLEK